MSNAARIPTGLRASAERPPGQLRLSASGAGGFASLPAAAGAAALEGPKLPKKSLCWCGSGKRYEDCHGRKTHERDRGQPPAAAPAPTSAPAQKKFKDKHKKR